MDYKKTSASGTTITRDMTDFDFETGNIYESLTIIAKRSNQISVKIKEELSKKLEEFASYTDNLEEVFENREQIEISRFYERLPKPVLVALHEFAEGEVYYKRPENLEEEEIPETIILM
jgi:DNA-directed RNA polymerase subunit K/omega